MFFLEYAPCIVITHEACNYRKSLKIVDVIILRLLADGRTNEEMSE